MKYLLFFLLFFLVNFWFSQTKAKVVGVKDGDTIEVLLEGNRTKILRLAEVDCPENGQAFGKNAKQFTSAEVFQKEITFFETDTDRYGRTIAKVYYEHNKYLSAELIKNGFGWWYYFYSDNMELKEFQQRAKSNSLGLWFDKNAISPWEFRKMKRN